MVAILSNICYGNIVAISECDKMGNSLSSEYCHVANLHVPDVDYINSSEQYTNEFMANQYNAYPAKVTVTYL